MVDFSQMLVRLVLSLALGTLIGFERESAGKEAGVRTSMLVAAGATIFTLIGLSMPDLLAQLSGTSRSVIAADTGFTNIIANIVVGIGFLGAGIIIKTEGHVHGLTTAAAIWTTAAIGTLVGLGYTAFAVTATIIIYGLLYVLRTFDLTSSQQSKPRKTTATRKNTQTKVSKEIKKPAHEDAS